MNCPNTKAHDGGYFSSGTWGFIVYRLTYKDQALLDDYLEYIHKAVRAMIDWQVSEELWEPPGFPAPPNPREAEIRAEAEEEKNNFHLCLREGPELDGRSIEDVRAINSNWLLGLRPVLPPELSWQCNWSVRTSDLTFVMCVDDDILERFQKLRTAKTAGAEADRLPGYDDDILERFQKLRMAKTSDAEASMSPSYHDDVAVKMVWTGYGIYKDKNYPTDEELDEHGGNDSSKIWQYMHVYLLPGFSNALLGGHGVWWYRFVQPPGLNRPRHGPPEEWTCV